MKFGCQAYYFLRNKNIITTICCDVDDSNINYIKNMLLKISFSFLQKYGEVLNNWNGNIHSFKDFRLPRSLEDKNLELNNLKNYERYFENVNKYKQELINYINVTNLPDTSKKRILNLIEKMNLICTEVYENFQLDGFIDENK